MNENGIPRSEDWASLRVLEEIGLNPSISQRELSRRVGVSLGFTNLLVRRMARKAWIKMRTIPGRRVLYALTPRGLSEKVRKTQDFVRISFRYYNEMRRLVVTRLRETGRTKPRVALFGPAEFSGIVDEAARDMGGQCVGTAEAGLPDGSIDVVVVLSPAPPERQEAWHRAGASIVDLS